MQKQKAGWGVHLALFTVNLLYGANYLVAKQVMPKHLDAYTFILLRLSICTVLFWLVGCFFPKQQIQKEDWLRIIGCSLFGMTLNQLLFFKGLSLTSSINASLIMITTPICVLMMSAIILKDRLQTKQVVGVLCGLSGAAMIILSGNPSKTQALQLSSGDLLILLNALSFALYLVIAKPLMAKYHPLTLVKWMFLLATITVLPFLFKGLYQVNWASWDGSIWLSFLYVIIGATFMVYLLNTVALKKATPVLLSTYIYLQPFFAALLAALFGLEMISIQQGIAGIVIIFGVNLVSKSKQSPQKSEDSVKNAENEVLDLG